MTEDEFVAAVTEGQPTRPHYFSFDAQRNRSDHRLLDETMSPKPLQLWQVLDLVGAGAVALDTRDPADFAAGHLRGAINVGLQGRFAEFAGDVLDPDCQVVLVGDPATALESTVRLARIGFDTVTGYLDNPRELLIDRPDLVEARSRHARSPRRPRRAVRHLLVDEGMLVHVVHRLGHGGPGGMARGRQSAGL